MHAQIDQLYAALAELEALVANGEEVGCFRKLLKRLMGRVSFLRSKGGSGSRRSGSDGRAQRQQE
eukprot:2344833-Pyramimonas_sp.AAC.2